MDKSAMPPIDRAAKALAQSQGFGDWLALDAKAQEQSRATVRLVLQALRDPDQAMTESGAEIIRNVQQEESSEAYMSDAANTWRFMIDALLSEST